MKISFVIPFYGADIGGGAETLCRRLAENLVLRGVDVEVLTTTIRGLASDWNKNYYEPGLYDVNGVSTRRFLPRSVDTDVFIPINHKLVRREPISFEEEIAYMENAINSDAMYRYIGDNQKDRFYFFIPYLFGTSLHGSAVAPQKSFLIPCLHDEGYADMKITGKMFDRALGALFLSKAEARLASRLYNGLRHTEKFLLGCGVDRISGADGERFRKNYGLENTPFILYVGRRDKGKNVPLLYDFFARYKKKYPNSPVKLVSIGPESVPVPEEVKDDVLDLGFVSIQDKRDSYAAATVMCQPSLMESFSIVIMESWLCGRPVMVHSDCAVTSEHVKDSGGGFAFGSMAEFSESLNLILDEPAAADEMGERGRAYVEENYTWDKVTGRFLRLMDALKEISFA